MGEFGERGGDPQVPDGFDSEFVMAAAKVLQEREPGDDDCGGAVGAQAPHGSQPMFKAAVIGFDSIVRVPFDVVPRVDRRGIRRGAPNSEVQK